MQRQHFPNANVCVYEYAYKPTLAHTHFPFGFSVYPHFFFFPVHLFQKYRVVGFFLLFTLTHHDRHRAISLYSICYLNFPLTTGMRVCEYTSSSFSCCCFCLYFLSLDRIYNINPFYSFFLSLSTLPLSFYLSSLSFDWCTLQTLQYTIRIYTSTHRIKSSCVCNSGKIDDEQRMNTLFPLFAVEFSIFSFDGFGFSLFFRFNFIHSFLPSFFPISIYVLHCVSVGMSAPICVYESVFFLLLFRYIYCILFRLLLQEIYG